MAPPPRDLRAQQAAEREDQMRDRFGLMPGGQGRPGVDALLPLGHLEPLSPGMLEEPEMVPFELKSTDSDSVSTARDVGREHIEKWRQRHWLFGFYVRGTRNPPVARRYIYVSPRQLEPWIAEQEDYVLADWELVRRLPSHVDRDVLITVAGDKELYSLDDAQRVLKQQKLGSQEDLDPEIRAALEAARIRNPRKMTTPLYRALMDRPAGYSPTRMLALLRERARYLLDRGATRNNPHIPEATILRLAGPAQVIAEASPRKAQSLEEMVRAELRFR
jgi:hypothetical protein